MLYQFINDLLFGNKKYESKLSSNILVNQLIYDVGKYINIKNTIRNGGILRNDILVQKELGYIIDYIDRGNSYHFEKSTMRNKTDLALKSEIVRSFFNNLSHVCRGNLKEGVVANTYEKKAIRFDRTDEETLEHILNDDNDMYESYKNPEYWGFLAKQLIQKKRPFNIPMVKVTRNVLQKAQILYDLKCKSTGTIKSPFSYILVPHSSYLDPIYWESVESLIMFIEHCPEHKLSKTVRNLLNEVVKAIMNAEDSALPNNILDNESQIRKFIKNIDILHNRIEKVSGTDTPLKLIDVFHRVLALSKYDYMWEEIDLFFEKNEKNILAQLFIRNLELVRDNTILRSMISKNGL